jgi:hypothetical protein
MLNTVYILNVLIHWFVQCNYVQKAVQFISLKICQSVLTSRHLHYVLSVQTNIYHAIPEPFNFRVFDLVYVRSDWSTLTQSVTNTPKYGPLQRPSCI